ncbi:ACT-like tyrosine kinase family protein, partial [Trifolium medium]|nr:ACT-like tyrosine kinase family protein [Trifolium medium]
MIHIIFSVPCGQYHFGIGILVQLHSSSDENTAESFQPYAPGEDSVQSSSKILPPPAFGSSPNLEALALEENDS